MRVLGYEGGSAIIRYSYYEPLINDASISSSNSETDSGFTFQVCEEGSGRLSRKITSSETIAVGLIPKGVYGTLSLPVFVSRSLDLF